MHTKEKFRKQDFVYLLLLTVIIIFLYSFSWHYPIYNGWDDATYILNNGHLSFSFSNILRWFAKPYHSMYIPITMLSYMFDYSVRGLSSFGYHLQNIFWHIVAVIAIYKCFRLFGIKPWITFFLCLIFAVHPQRVESVVWLSERKDVLCTAFYFLSIYFYIKNFDKKFSIAALGFFILSMLSKPTAISLPIILLLYEFYRNNKAKKLELADYRLKEKTEKFQVLCGYICYLLKLWPYFLILLIFIPISIIAQGTATVPNNSILSFHKLYMVLFNVYWYTTQTLFPTDLNPIQPLVHPFYSIIEMLLFYTGILFLTVVLPVLKLSCFSKFKMGLSSQKERLKIHNKNRHVSIENKRLFIYDIIPLIIAYIITLLPVIGLIRLGSIDHADRYSYIPSVFIWFSIGLILNRILYMQKPIDVSKLNQRISPHPKHRSFYNKNGLTYKNEFVNRNAYVKGLVNKAFAYAILAIYSFVLFFFNYHYQKKWKNVHILFNHAANCLPVNNTALIGLGDIELSKGNDEKVLIIAEKLKDKDKLVALFFEASVMFRKDKISAVKLLLNVKPLLKNSYNYNDYHNRYISVLGMLSIYYYSIEKIEEAIKYNNEILSIPRLNTFMRFFCLGLNEYYLKNYRKAIYLFRKALKLRPNDKAVLKKINSCMNCLNI